MFNLRKIDLKFVFCYISPCNFFYQNCLYLIFYPWKFFFFNLRVYMTTKHILYSKHNFFFSFLAHLGPLRGNKVFKSLKKYVLYSSIIYLWIQMSFRMFIFNWNPKNWHYLYPPFFLPKKAKEENTPFLRGHNSWSYQYFASIFFLVTL